MILLLFELELFYPGHGNITQCNESRCVRSDRRRRLEMTWSSYLNTRILDIAQDGAQEPIFHKTTKVNFGGLFEAY